ncbi:alanine racemase [Candidatus Nitronereus thalassa]|uniref:Alanine racemase n=1 Tax=Candidatus Nitronereus thalassa TaxID=3020898 RepID=A0ABU3K4T2_9BACT|nr:alanine racemase [Candidatus Nitronereus thalassa]MDT7041410.1 alanine racemase [Candidatus Nitronereus thalassa]
MTASLSLFPPPVSSYLSPTTAIIHLHALAHNLSALRTFLAPRCEILAVVKADGYGHGSIVIAKTLAQLGITKFGVATIQEGVALREAGLTGSIIVLGATFSWQLPDLIHYQLTPVISDADTAHQFAKELSPDQTPYPVHIKVDTGMRRLGLSPDALTSLLDSPLFQGSLVLESLMTHLADADSVDPAFTHYQLDQFQSMVDQLRLKGIMIPSLHAANTAGIVAHPQSHLDMVRPGLLLYGYQPVLPFATALDLKPVLSLVTKLAQTKSVGAGEPLSYNGIFRTARPSQIGILPIGYAHGYHRRLSNQGKVLIGNTRVPIVGRICMDMTLIDITDVPNAKVGDEVVLLGTQGKESISATDIAQWQDSIPYEVLCSIGPRVNRKYEPLS